MLKNIFEFVIIVFLAIGVGISGNYIHQNFLSVKGKTEFNGDYEEIIVKSAKSVVLFSSSTCEFCKKAIDFLEKEEVDYINYVVNEDDKALELYMTLGKSSVPILLNENKMLLGFSKEKYLNFLEIIKKTSNNI